MTLWSAIRISIKAAKAENYAIFGTASGYIHEDYDHQDGQVCGARLTKLMSVRRADPLDLLGELGPTYP